MLGAIDQTLWGKRGEPPLGHDGTPGPRQREACGSFFVQANYEAGVELLANFVSNYGQDMVKVGDAYITCSWDEIGLRTRSMIDYRPEAVAEYRRYLREVWFGDRSPGDDTNGDGRTYNAFTGEELADWDQVRPPALSPAFYRAAQPADEKWSRTGAFKLWMDFHRYYTFEFFRRVSAGASARAGRRVECYPFPQAFIVWPGANAFQGLSYYWNARLNPIITNQQCGPDAAGMAVNYAQTDRLARLNKNVVMGWSWFWFPANARDFYDGEGDIERALARMMGHRVDGIHHWLYSPQYRGTHQGQRLQLAYWHNFLGKHYAPFLSRSAPPVPEVAILLPDYTGYFYRKFAYPKMDYAYTAQALLEAQIPFEIVAEEEIELDPEALSPYKVLYVAGSEWTTPTIRRRIQQFIARGGHVFANADSLSLDIPSGRRTDFLARTFGVELTRKHKNPFYPSAQTPEEEAWAAALMGRGKPLRFQGSDVHKPDRLSRLWRVQDGRTIRNEEAWEELDKVMAAMPKKGRGGLPQSGIDMSRPPQITYTPALGPRDGLVTYGEINIGSATAAGRPIAWHDEQVCGVETERTVWLGTRPGMSMHAIAPRMSLSRTTEPCNPFLAQVSDRYESHRPYVDIIAYAARRAGVRPLVTLSLNGRIPCNLEVLPRVDEAGNMMVIVINHDQTDATYDVRIARQYVAEKLPEGATALDLLGDEVIEEDTDGRFPFAVPPGRPAVLFIGAGDVLARVREAQRSLNAMDMSVPQYFLDRPELNERPWGATLIPQEETQPDDGGEQEQLPPE